MDKNKKYYALVLLVVATTMFSIAAKQKNVVDPECKAIGFNAVIEKYNLVTTNNVHAGNILKLREGGYFSDITSDHYSYASMFPIGYYVTYTDGTKDVVPYFYSDYRFGSLETNGKSIEQIKVCYNKILQ